MQGSAQEFVIAGPALVMDVLARFGHVRIRARGTSMLPTIQPGDVLDVQRCSSEELQPGDVALVLGAAGLRAHRVVARRGCDVVVTRGDAHWRCDAADAAMDVLGRVVSVTRENSSSSVSQSCSLLSRVRGLAHNESTRIAGSVRRALRRTLVASAMFSVR